MKRHTPTARIRAEQAHERRRYAERAATLEAELARARRDGAALRQDVHYLYRALWRIGWGGAAERHEQDAYQYARAVLRSPTGQRYAVKP